MIDHDLIQEKLNLITRDLGHLRAFSQATFQEVASDFMKYAAIKNVLMEVIGRALDINQHLIGELAQPTTEVPKTYRETFLILGKLSVLPKQFSEDISKSAGFRNAIVHAYNHLDEMDVYKTIGMAIEQYTSYCKHIIKFLKNNAGDR